MVLVFLWHAISFGYQKYKIPIKDKDLFILKYQSAIANNILVSRWPGATVDSKERQVESFPPKT